jgi:hypothetical protein
MNGQAGSSGDLSRPETERSRQGLEEIPVSPERPRGDPPEPGLVDGHHLHPDAGRLRLPDGGDRLVRPLCFVLEAALHAGQQFCIEALEEALGQGKPEIFNTDQGVQYTSDSFITALETRQIRVSMDGKGRAFDNVFVKRLWRTVKDEEVYLKAYEGVPELKRSLKEYFIFYNEVRSHQSLSYKTPEKIDREVLDVKEEVH